MFNLPNGNLFQSQSDFSAGIADYEKGGEPNEYAFGRSVDYRTNPLELTLLPKTTKESGTVVTDLPKDGDLVGTSLFYYGDTGNIYKRTSAGSHSLQRTVADSHGNGMKYYTEDDFLYYTSDTAIGRYGQATGSTPTWSDDFLGAEGGVPLNTNSLDFEAGSSQYLSRADTATTSITGDLAIECYIKPESLPTAGNTMVLASKWDIDANKRSYKFEIHATSGYFGDGSDGALTVATTDDYDSSFSVPLIDSACTGISGESTLAATNASFASDQIILIHQTRGAGAGTYQRNRITGYTAGTVSLETPLNATYVSGAQVLVLRQFTNVTINSGVILLAKPWNGSTGGILSFIASGTVTVSATGSINATGRGYRGGAAGNNTINASPQGHQGEGTAGYGTDSYAASNFLANGNGGGGGSNGSIPQNAGAGGGGGNGTVGSDGTSVAGSTRGVLGATAGTVDLTTATFGGGGGGGQGNNNDGGVGGAGGGFIFISAIAFSVSGSIVSDGLPGAGTEGGGGGGAGGSILLKAQTATLGGSLSAVGATGGATRGGTGGAGRIHIDYLTSYTGTSIPTIDVAQDNNLVTTTTYQLRLGLSSDGTAEEFLARNSTLTTGAWQHVAVSWDASAATASFYQDAVSLGTSTGAVTSLNDNASVFGVAADFNTTARNFYDGKMDELRLWASEITADQILLNKDVEIPVNSIGLNAYYQLDGTTDDSTSNANHLTASNSPTSVTDVPFSSPTSRRDLDQSLDTSGNTYALTTSISETAANKQTFVPDKDPQKSIEVNISDTGDDSDWTLTVHDSLNRVVASKTVTHAQLHTGDFEFIFDTAWRPIRGASYHFHLTATTTTGSPLVVSTSANDLETADFHTYYQFLVDDSDYHPIEQMLNFLVIGNDRYVAKYAADGDYEPHRLVLPSGWRVRCFGFWRGYIAIGCWKDTSISDTDQGIIFLWDGIAETYIDAIRVPEGAINALLGSKGKLYVWAGYNGDQYVYNGGDGVDEVETKRIPKMSETKYIETMPKAVTMWKALVRWGVAGTSDSSDVERGVYTYGRRKASNPVSLSYDYPISTGSLATTNVKIGFIFPVARKLLIGWKDNTAYGMDVVDQTASPFTTGIIERSIEDFGVVWKDKKTLIVRADFKPLNTGEAIKIKYKLNRSSSWTEGATDNESGYAATAGNTYARLNIPTGDAKEIQIAAELTTSVSTAPTLLQLGEEVNPNKNQAIV